MALKKIPVRNDLPSYNFRIDLDDRVFKLTFKYNQRLDLWHMDIADEEDVDLILGIPLFSDTNILPIIKRPNFPQGDFILAHETEDFKNASRETFGAEVIMYYQEAL